MKKIQLANKASKLKVISSFSEMSIPVLQDYKQIQRNIEILFESWEEVNAHFETAILDFEESKERIEAIRIDLHMERMRMFELLCVSKRRLKKQLKKYAIGFESSAQIAQFIYNHLGSFNDFWENCPAIDSIGSWFNRYVVHDIGSNTVSRDHLTARRLERVFKEGQKIDNDEWDSVLDLLATILRPKKQNREIAFNKNAFINQKQLKGYDPKNALDYYNEQLDQQIEKTKKRLSKIKVGEAVGLIKYYCAKKKAS